MIRPSKVHFPTDTVPVEYVWTNDTDYGEFITLRNTIEVNQNLSDDVMRQTLLHELLHAIESHNSGITLLTETQVEHISSYLLYILRNNDELLTYLTHND